MSRVGSAESGFENSWCNDKCVFVYDCLFYSIHSPFIHFRKVQREDNNVQLFNKWLTRNMYKGSERLMTSDIQMLAHLNLTGGISCRLQQLSIDWSIGSRSCYLGHVYLFGALFETIVNVHVLKKRFY